MRFTSLFKSRNRIHQDLVMIDLGSSGALSFVLERKWKHKAYHIAGLSSVIRTRQWGVRHQGIEHCVWICLTPIPKKQCQLVLLRTVLCTDAASVAQIL